MIITALEEGNDEEVVASIETDVEQPTQNEPISTTFPEFDDNERDFELEEMMIAALEEGLEEDLPAPETVSENTIQNQPPFSIPTDTTTTTYDVGQPLTAIDPALTSFHNPGEATTLQTAPEYKFNPFSEEDLDKLLADIDAQMELGHQPQQSQFDAFQSTIPSFGGIQAQPESTSNNPANPAFIFNTPQTQVPKPDKKPQEHISTQLPPPTGDMIFKTPTQAAQRNKAVPKSIASRVTPNITNRPKATPKSIRDRLARRNDEN
jgi:hypothetical protein